MVVYKSKSPSSKSNVHLAYSITKLDFKKKCWCLIHFRPSKKFCAHQNARTLKKFIGLQTILHEKYLTVTDLKAHETTIIWLLYRFFTKDMYYLRKHTSNSYKFKILRKILTNKTNKYPAANPNLDVYKWTCTTTNLAHNWKPDP